MRLLMVSGDRQVTIGERGPFHAMLREFSRYFERIDVLCPQPPGEVTVRTIHERVHFHPATVGRRGMVAYIADAGRELLAAHGHALIVSHDYGWFYNGLGSAHLSRTHGVPYLSEIHHVPGVPVAGGVRERFDKWVARAYVRWARNRAIAFRVVNSTEMPALLASWGVPRDRILVLPSLYIDAAVFRPAPEPVEPAVDVVFVGRLVANKGVERILEALAILKRRGGSSARGCSSARARSPRACASGRAPAGSTRASSTGSTRPRSWPSSTARAACACAPRPARAGRASRSRPWRAGRRWCPRRSE